MQAMATAGASRAKRARSRDVDSSISIALAGSGGSGVMTAGTLLLNAAAKAGLYGIMVRTSGPMAGPNPKLERASRPRPAILLRLPTWI